MRSRRQVRHRYRWLRREDRHFIHRTASRRQSSCESDPRAEPPDRSLHHPDGGSDILAVKVDDLFKAHPQRLPERPRVGFQPKITDAELVTLAVLQVLLGHTSERRWLRHATAHLMPWFPYLPRQPGYNKRLRKLAVTFNWLITTLARDTSVADDDVWIVDSTPVECARSRETVKRSELAGWAEYGYCASHSRFFWGLRLHLLATLHGLPVGWMLTGAKADEREALAEILASLELAPAGSAASC